MTFISALLLIRVEITIDNVCLINFSLVEVGRKMSDTFALLL